MKKRCLVLLGAVVLSASLAACAESSESTPETSTSTASETTAAQTTEARETTTLNPWDYRVVAESQATNTWAFHTDQARCEVQQALGQQPAVRCELDYKYAPTETDIDSANYRSRQDGVELHEGVAGFRPVTLGSPTLHEGPALPAASLVNLGDVTVEHPAEAELVVSVGDYSFTFSQGILDTTTWHGNGTFGGARAYQGASCAADKAASATTGLSIIARADGLDCDEARAIYESYQARGNDDAEKATTSKRATWKCQRGPGIPNSKDGVDTRGVICDTSTGQHFLVIPPTAQAKNSATKTVNTSTTAATASAN